MPSALPFEHGLDASGRPPPLPLAQSRQRSRDFGLAASRAPDPELPSHADMAELLSRNEALRTHARPVMETLREQIAGTDSMVLLTDHHGTILHALGDDDFLVRASRVALRPGVTWSERQRGTNAIGTALAEGDAVQVHAGEHYLQANHVLTCACAPIRDPLGQVVGALDVSGDHRQPQGHTLALVRMSAQMVENHLFATHFERSIQLHFHARAEFVGTLVEGLVAFTPDGRFLSANRSGQFQLGLPLRALQAHTFASLFGASMAELLAHIWRQGLAPLRLRLHNGMTVVARASFDRPVQLSLSTPPPADTPPAPRAAPQPRERAGLAALADTHDAAITLAVQQARKVLDHAGISILIRGETGTGKEVFARALHQASRRRNGPFVAVNCAAIPDTLIESELFGYEEGAFTGARRKGHPGKVQQAHGGTLFLDEIGDMPLPMQGRLLRVLQEQVVTPLGGTRDVAVDVRIVSATHRDLHALMAQGLFRDDLYYRLDGLSLRLPALREREDLATLIDQLVATHAQAAGITPPPLDDVARALLLAHTWPGNFRQLHNVLRHAVLMAEDAGRAARIGLQHLPADFVAADAATPAPITPARPARGPAAAPPSPALQAITAQAVADALARHGGNVSAAARALAVSRNTVYRHLRRSGPG
ncbi:MAG: Acetoin catabolism regulatory protein [Paracidovorax wautersii]|uniref:Acetoin catabolism regulatory protein n=1 Tax=Paracidovorax wautersii TaxID=1177982 RepID=A0A7V8FMC4_9BURK|nr:MAG: Acetoin catabolism regulatory protein [Paracidovorax wautersii]